MASGNFLVLVVAAPLVASTVLTAPPLTPDGPTAVVTNACREHLVIDYDSVSYVVSPDDEIPNVADITASEGYFIETEVDGLAIQYTGYEAGEPVYQGIIVRTENPISGPTVDMLPGEFIQQKFDKSANPDGWGAWEYSEENVLSYAHVPGF